jgi:hypothetical protein
VLSPESCTINPTYGCILTATTKDASGNTLTGRTVTWTSGTAASATVSSAGVVTGVAPGTSTITATSEGKTANAAITVANSSSATVVVQVDAAVAGSAIADLFGVNKGPRFNGSVAGTTNDASTLYQSFGITQARLHDSAVDVCGTYTPVTKTNMNSPSTPITGCTLAGSGGQLPWFRLTPNSSADTALNNTANYDFSATDAALAATTAAGSRVYLRLGDAFNGPNDTADPVAYAKIVTNIYKHVIGQFKAGTTTTDPVYVEVWNEPDGKFWRGTNAAFYTFFTETVTRVRAAAAAAGKTVVIGGPGFTATFMETSSTNLTHGFVSNVGVANLDFFSVHHYGSCATATLATAAQFLRTVRTYADGQGLSGKPLHITEWNMGLGEICGEPLYSDQRMQSYASGMLTLMQDPAQNIKAAHFYSGVTVMSLFDFSSSPGNVRVNPSAWAFWAHTKLKGSTAISAKVCPGGLNCVNGYAAENQPLLALAGSGTGVRTAVVTNDGASSVTYTVKFTGLTGASVNATILTPPAGTRDLPLSGAPLKPLSTGITSLLALPTSETRSALGLSSGQLEMTLTLPSHTLQVIEIR